MKTFTQYINEHQKEKIEQFAKEQWDTPEKKASLQKIIDKTNKRLTKNEKVNTENPDDAYSIDRDKQDSFDKISTMVQHTNGYVRDYKDSHKIIDALIQKGFLEKDKGSGGTLYTHHGGGILVYWLTYSDMEVLLRMLVYFHHYLRKFEYEDKKTGWRFCFDIHDDPMTGAEYKTTGWYLDFTTKSNDTKAIDKGIEELYDEIMSAEVYWQKKDKLTESQLQENYFEMINETFK